jgi:hypothetical protein
MVMIEDWRFMAVVMLLIILCAMLPIAFDAV